MKIGVFGGTFNPIHTAHVRMAQDFYNELRLDRLIVIPTFMPPHKSVKHLASADDRLAMCGLAVKGLPGFEVCDYEITERDKSYTYRTLRFLKGKYPDSELYLLTGADMFFTVQDWRQPQEIYKMAVICAVPREHGEGAAVDFQAVRLRNEGARCMVLSIEPTPLSSTIIREKIKAGEDVTEMLGPEVWQYIKENRLYGA